MKPISPFEDRLVDEYETLFNIMVEKRRLRGADNITRQGMAGVVRRIAEDKLERVKREVEKNDFLEKAKAILPESLYNQVACYFNGSVPEDSLIDDLHDIANYAIICIMLIKGTWNSSDTRTTNENARQKNDR